MSVRTIQGQGGFRDLGGSNVGSKLLRSVSPARGPWVRNPLWPAVATPAANEILALYAAFGETGAPDFIALNCGVSEGQYRVQLGDGTDVNVNSNTQFEGSINFAALPDLGLPYRICTVRITPVNVNATFSTINLAARHTSLTISNPIANWLEVKVNAPVSATIAICGASNVTKASYLENVEILPAAWAPSNGFLNQGATNLRRAVIGFNNSSNFLLSGMFTNCRVLTEVIIVNNGPGLPNLTSSMFSGCASLTSVPLFDTSSVTSMTGMFSSCFSLTSVPLFNTAAVTAMNSMFSNCASLTSVPLFNTAATTTMNFMFQRCASLTSVPLFNTAAVTNMANMFTNCASLTSVPLFNTAAVTTMDSMFSSCFSLTSVPLFNTAAVTAMNSMFSSCFSLTSVPLFNTAAVTAMNSMFSSCSSLTSVPLFNTAAVTNMSDMFNGCISLPSVPLFNTAAVTNMSNMFNGCSSLTSVPLFNTAAVTNMSGMFNSCFNLRVIPALNFAGVSSSGNLNNIFASCVLQRIRATGARFTHTIASNSLSGAALDEYYTGLPTVTGQTLTVTGNYGTATDTPSIATAKGWTVTGS